MWLLWLIPGISCLAAGNGTTRSIDITLGTGRNSTCIGLACTLDYIQCSFLCVLCNIFFWHGVGIGLELKGLGVGNDQKSKHIMQYEKHMHDMQQKSQLCITSCHYRFPGGLKEIPVKEAFYKDPSRVIHWAVYGMLPKNKLRSVSPSVLESHPYFGGNLID